MQMEELRKQWITSEKEYREGEVFVYRQKFTASQVKKAVFYGTALGVYEAELNGTKIGRQMFAPGFSYYPRRVLYQTHEVTKLLREGENTLTVYLGQGWYCGRFLCENQTQIYGEQPAVAWILELEDAAGSRKIVSDETVEELESPYEYAGEYDGEIYFADGRENVTGHAAAYTKETPFALEPTLTEVRLQDEMSVRETTVQGDVTILDFGQNFAGIVEIDPSFLKNETITIRHGEILNADGSLYTANLRKAKATIVYHAGAEKKKYRPRFTYMGFRYMELSGAAYQPGMIRAYALHTEMKRTGYFSCENPLVQKLYENQVWGQKSNYVEVPTDCPQRDERMGYTGDGQVFALTGAYNFNTDAFWKNFLRDLELGQLDNTEGYVCATVPQGNAVTILPEMMYRQFGDEEALPRQYESMKLFVEAEIRKMGKKNLWIGPSLGDWLAMGKGIAWQAMHNNPVSNAFIVHDLKVISETAERLGKREDAARYRRQLAATTDAYIKKFVSKNGIVAKDYQSAYIMALKYVLPEGELRERVKKNFVANIRKNGLQTGFFATEHLLPLLVEAGEQKLAYDVLLQENCPGWMYQVKCGATTTWERWDALKPDGTVNEEKMAGSGENMVSFNHYAFGSVGEFYYQYILGIRPEKPGFAKLHFAPYPDERLGGVSGSYLSVAGKIESAWRYEADGCHIRLATPVEAVVLLPDGRSENVPAGTYEWTVKRPNL